MSGLLLKHLAAKGCRYAVLFRHTALYSACNSLHSLACRGCAATLWGLGLCLSQLCIACLTRLTSAAIVVADSLSHLHAHLMQKPSHLLQGREAAQQELATSSGAGCRVSRGVV